MQMRPFRTSMILLVVVSFLGTGAALAEQRSHKLLAAPNQIDETKDGVTLIQDYGSYRLYRVRDDVADAFPEARRADDMDVIKLDAYPINTREPVTGLPPALTASAGSGPALHLVQFVGPIKEGWLEELRQAGVRPIQYIESNAYLVWADTAGRQALDRLAAGSAFLQYSGPYHPYYKLGPTLRDPAVEAVAERLIPVTIQILAHEGKDATHARIASLAASIDSGWQSVLEYEDVEATVPISRVAAIAALPDVVWIGERFSYELNDEVQDQIVAAHFDGTQSGPSAPGYKAFLDAKGFSQNPSDYSIVVVTDDGVGNGSAVNGSSDPTLTLLGDGTTTRLLAIANCTTDADARSVGGHGHINTSIVGGYDVRAGDPFRDPDGYQRGMGLNPYGRMAHTKIFTNTGSCNTTACPGGSAGCLGASQAQITSNVQSGARISSNSWGCAGCAGTYSADSQAYDAGTRDADPNTAGNQQLLFVFAAGNSGSSSATVGTPGNGKNMITVGASENDRPTWSDGCGATPTDANNAMDVVGFSSRGPAPGNRKKPEVIAPGTHIQGTASTSPGYNGSSVCDQFMPTTQTIFAASSGTSHSTPAVAGVASLYDRWLQDHFLHAIPSPALLKAYMMTHTTYLTGVSANDTLPSNNQGYGMPTLEMAFDDAARYLLDQSAVLDNSGDTWTFHGTVADPSKPLRVMMVYTDAPGAVGTSPQVNNLDLAVAVNGTTYLGNVYSGQFSTTGGTADTANNYEGVFLPAGTVGAIDITVTGFNIAGNGVPNVGDATDQDFALVCYNCSQCASSLTLNKSVYNCSASINLTLVDLDLAGSGTYAIDVRSTTESTPESVTLTESPASSGVFVGSVATSSAAAVHGDGMLSVHDGDTVTGSYTDASSCGSSNVLVEKSAAIDCVGPVISNVRAENVTGNSADVKWDTNEGASSRASYGLSTPPGTTTPLNSALVASHSLRLSTLQECSTYYYSVQSTDAASNTTTANNGNSYYAFATGKNVNPVYPYAGAPVSIPDNLPAGAEATVSVPDVNTLVDVDVLLHVTHSYDGDLLIKLIAPDATEVILSNLRGGGGDNFDNTVFDDEASTPIAGGSAPFAGSFKPDQPLSALDGKNPNGTWHLKIIDQAGADTGTIDAFELRLSYPPQACGPSLTYVSNAKTEACNGSGSGGGNGVVEPGETVTLPITLKNNGTAATTGIAAALTTSTPGVSVTTDSSTYPDLAAGQSAAGNTAFVVQIGQGMACGTVINLRLHASASQGAWDSNFTLLVGAPGSGGGTTASSDVPKTITDFSTVTSTLSVAATDAVTDVNVSGVAITHSYDGDLVLTLIGPNGTRVMLSNRRGAGGDNFTGTTFDDEAATAIGSGSAPFSGSFIPDAPLSGLDGIPANGTWTLEVQDAASGDTGALTAWSLTLTTTGPPICNACTPALLVPPEVTSLTWSSHAGVQWPAAAGATTYRVFRGEDSDVPKLLDAYNDSCNRLETASLSSGPVLTENPSPFRFKWYIVRGRNAAGLGPAGSGSLGTWIQNDSGICP